MLLDIIILGALALFLFVKFKGVLGNEYNDQFEEEKKKTRRIREVSPEEINQINITLQNKYETYNDADFMESSAIPNFNALQNILPGIHSKEFIEIAKKVFEIMLNSYTSNDLQMVQKLSSPNISQGLADAINDAITKNIKNINVLVAIDKAIITKVQILKNTAIISVRFDSQQINYTEDSNKKVIDGDKSSISTVSEVWDFTKDLSKNDPSWILTHIENC